MTARGQLRLAWFLLVSSVVVFVAAACAGILALESGHWITAAVNGGMMVWNIGLMAAQNVIIDRLTDLTRR
jgi:hypothetical protein